MQGNKLRKVNHVPKDTQKEAELHFNSVLPNFKASVFYTNAVSQLMPQCYRCGQLCGSGLWLPAFLPTWSHSMR